LGEGTCIVGVAAHAADMEFSAGATLLKHSTMGWDAHIIHLTLGEKGHAKLSVEDYGRQKRAEAEEAAEALQCTPHFLPHRDGELRADDSVAGEVARLLRRLGARVVIAHWSGSLHRDHVEAHHLTSQAVFIAANRHFELDGLNPSYARLYYADNWEDADGFEPSLFLDVSDVVEGWERAFECFAIGRGEGGYPYWDWYQARTRMHGIKLGVAHAQAFAVDPWRQYRCVETL
jgi:LmbE family N-acetylglucosaminyl deacetylase